MLMSTGVEAAAHEPSTHDHVKNNLLLYQAQSSIKQPPETLRGKWGSEVAPSSLSGTPSRDAL